MIRLYGRIMAWHVPAKHRYGFHTIEKAAKMLVNVMQITGDKKMQTVTLDGFKEIEKDFNLNLSDEFFIWEN